jgi:hypothetical protein
MVKDFYYVIRAWTKRGTYIYEKLTAHSVEEAKNKLIRSHPSIDKSTIEIMSRKSLPSGWKQWFLEIASLGEGRDMIARAKKAQHKRKLKKSGAKPLKRKN